MNFKEKLQHRWGLKSGWHVIGIMIIFAITGFSILYVKAPVFKFLGYHHIDSKFWRVFAYIGIMYPLYQIILLAVGTTFGQYRFFSGFLIKMNLRFVKPFMKKKN
jgi:hypothetical protein